MLLFNKTVDRSLLKEGFTIPINYQKGLLTEIGMDIPRGTKKRIRIVLGENVFEATIINIAFDANRYPHHGDLLQIRYPANGALAQALQSIFSCTVRRIEAMREMGGSTRVALYMIATLSLTIKQKHSITQMGMLKGCFSICISDESAQLRCAI